MEMSGRTTCCQQFKNLDPKHREIKEWNYENEPKYGLNVRSPSTIEYGNRTGWGWDLRIIPCVATPRRVLGHPIYPAADMEAPSSDFKHQFADVFCVITDPSKKSQKRTIKKSTVCKKSLNHKRGPQELVNCRVSNFWMKILSKEQTLEIISPPCVSRLCAGWIMI